MAASADLWLMAAVKPLLHGFAGTANQHFAITIKYAYLLSTKATGGILYGTGHYTR